MPQQEIPHRAGTPGAGMPPYVWLFVQLSLLLTLFPVLDLLELRYLREPLLAAQLWSPGPDRFGDFWHYRALFPLLHRPEFFLARDRFAYPAPCAVLFQALYHLGRRPHVVFDMLLWTIEGISAGMLFRALRRSGMRNGYAFGLVCLLVATSYPWHFLYDRGNIEVFTYIFVAGGLWAWLEGQNGLAAVLWGIAGSMKIYPLVLLVMFFRRDQARYFLLGLACCFAALLLSFWYVGPSIRMAAVGTLSGILGFVGHYGAHARSQELVFDHSILGGLKEVFEWPLLTRLKLIGTISRLYQLAVVLLGPVAFLLWRRRAPLLNQICLLLCALMLLPPVSYDYTLIYAYLVIGIVLCCAVQAARRGAPFPGGTSYMVAFAVVCTPETWILIHDMRPNGLLKCLALLTIAVNLVRFPLRLQGVAMEQISNARGAGDEGGLREEPAL